MKYVIRFCVTFAMMVATTIVVMCVMFGAGLPWHKVDGGLKTVIPIVVVIIVVVAALGYAWYRGHPLIAFGLGVLAGVVATAAAFTFHSSFDGDSTRLLVVALVLAMASALMTTRKGVLR